MRSSGERTDVYLYIYIYIYRDSASVESTRGASLTLAPITLCIVANPLVDRYSTEYTLQNNHIQKVPPTAAKAQQATSEDHVEHNLYDNN